MEQEDCHDLLVILREIPDRLFRLLEQYHRLRNFSMEGDDPLECNVGHSFVTQDPVHEGDDVLKSTKKLLVSYTAFTTRGVQLPVRRAFRIERFYEGSMS